MQDDSKLYPPAFSRENKEGKEIEVTLSSVENEEEESSEKVIVEETEDRTRAVTITLPIRVIEKIDDVADGKGKSRSRLVGEAIEYYLKKGEDNVSLQEVMSELKDIKNRLSPTPAPAPIVEDKSEDISRLLDDSTDSWEESFDLDEFLNSAIKQDLIGPVWTPGLLSELAEKLNAEADSEWFTDPRKELLAKTIQALQLSNEQADLLASKLGLRRKLEKKTKEDFKDEE